MTKITRILKIALPILIFSLVWIYPIIVYAQGPIDITTGSAVGDILMIVLKVALFTISILGSILITKSILYFEQKTKIDIPTATEKMLFDWADQAIGFAHEKAHQILQSDSKVLSGNEKLNIAVTFIMALVNKYNLVGVVEDRLKDYINAKLGTQRMITNTSDTVVVAK